MSHYNKLTESEERSWGPLISGQSVRALVTSEVTIAVQNGGSCWNLPTVAGRSEAQVTVSEVRRETVFGTELLPEESELSDR